MMSSWGCINTGIQLKRKAELNTQSDSSSPKLHWLGPWVNPNECYCGSEKEKSSDLYRLLRQREMGRACRFSGLLTIKMEMYWHAQV